MSTKIYDVILNDKYTQISAMIQVEAATETDAMRVANDIIDTDPLYSIYRSGWKISKAIEHDASRPAKVALELTVVIREHGDSYEVRTNDPKTPIRIRLLDMGKMMANGVPVQKIDQKYTELEMATTECQVEEIL